MIDVDSYLSIIGVGEIESKGGQELIYAEIIGSMQPMRTIYLPFPNSFLLQKLALQKIKVVNRIEEADCLYFGTPTIVDGRPLFPAEGSWNKQSERDYVREACLRAKQARVKRVIGGLGSGDISVEERQKDVLFGYGSKPEVVCMKKFDDFTDWVLVADLEAGNE